MIPVCSLFYGYFSTTVTIQKAIWVPKGHFLNIIINFKQLYHQGAEKRKEPVVA